MRETCTGKTACNVASFPSSTQIFRKFGKVLFCVIRPGTIHTLVANIAFYAGDTTTFEEDLVKYV